MYALLLTYLPPPSTLTLSWLGLSCLPQKPELAGRVIQKIADEMSTQNDQGRDVQELEGSLAFELEG